MKDLGGTILNRYSSRSQKNNMDLSLVVLRFNVSSLVAWTFFLIFAPLKNFF